MSQKFDEKFSYSEVPSSKRNETSFEQNFKFGHAGMSSSSETIIASHRTCKTQFESAYIFDFYRFSFCTPK